LLESLQKAAAWEFPKEKNSRKNLFQDIIDCDSNMDFAVISEKYSMKLSIKDKFHIITASTTNTASFNNTKLLEIIDDYLKTTLKENGNDSITHISNNLIFVAINKNYVENQVYEGLYSLLCKMLSTPVIFALSKPASGINELKATLIDAPNLNKYAFFCKYMDILHEEYILQNKKTIPAHTIERYISKIRSAIMEIDELGMLDYIRYLFLEVLKHSLDFDAYHLAYNRLLQLYDGFFSMNPLSDKTPLLPGREAYIEDIAEQMLVRFKAVFRTMYPGVNNNPVVMNAVRFIRLHFLEDVALADVAEHANVSTSYLSTLLKKHLSMNFTEYLLHIRLIRAKMHLADEKYKVYEIADLAGFRDAKYFSRMFKKNTGCSPREYRETYISSSEVRI
jgi:AraC-like DNA-binding protein